MKKLTKVQTKLECRVKKVPNKEEKHLTSREKWAEHN